jgi:hypothetical protein
MGKRVEVKRSTKGSDSREFVNFDEVVGGAGVGGADFRSVSAGDESAAAREDGGEGGVPVFGAGESGGAPTGSAAARITGAAFSSSTGAGRFLDDQ